MLHSRVKSVNVDIHLLAEGVDAAVGETGSTGAAGGCVAERGAGGESDADAAVPLGFCRWHCTVS